uniref:homeobox protein CDX-1-like n=1 Tax=Doryrhamphus excisus TaxID=161450 RepID=UPI0025ADF6DE|nr:homeobox protein CDX-1-like [Doryrhamphus excisus]XP_057919451.1 homeobox protein CDX-1-like [Doryrhamphus excisus]XP_057919452.1 homeobox protein CDX-1-like [Doryrhamphus excisus]XP_057919453.1 homeobox protein CDX-1-like [Doryrhamphus excisus]XP_057919454.1 homeobox protein CDX-1-like [Doryrhamphus excisus]XP_057919456.1 homeobox protein CDX-1-like [Doryrhamphus excisus]XP_057919457.1 homeobox protein CDX-1-like [Doryrhamphus excisus]XP_057919458.1 homeobox protein CDX-1-like [Doryrhamp
MYPNSQPARHPAQALPINGQFMAPSYDFAAYHHMPPVADPSGSAWNSLYREDYSYSFPGPGPAAGQVNFAAAELSGTPTATGGGGGGGGGLTPYNLFSSQDPFCSRRRPLEHVKPSAPPGGKTRTKDKYRVVYTDHQRQELETEFQFNRYITMRRKSELSVALSLSERQVKIWFQNRRAKERKINRKKLQDSQQPSTSSTTPPVPTGSTDGHNATSPGSHILSNAISEYKMEFI